MKKIKIFVASPGDVAEERKVVDEVVKELNDLWASEKNIYFDVIKWETHTRPGLGEDAQDVVNRQLPWDFDVFIGIMWTRFGSPTKRASSGTEEEFRRALSGYRAEKKPREILFYFKSGQVDFNELDLDQAGRVRALKDEISNEIGGLRAEFVDLDDFEKQLRLHLSQLLRDWDKDEEDSPSKEPSDESLSVTETEELSSEMSSLKNLSMLSEIDEDKLDISEAVHEAELALENALEHLNNLAGVVKVVGTQLTQRAEETKDLVGKGKPIKRSQAEVIFNASAKDIENYVQSTAKILPALHSSFGAGMKQYIKIVSDPSIWDSTASPEREKLRTELLSLNEATVTSASQVGNFLSSMEELPGLNARFNRARRRAIAVTKDVRDWLTRVSSQSQELASALEKSDT